MSTYPIRRILQAIPLLCIVSVLLFALVRLASNGLFAQYGVPQTKTATSADTNSVGIAEQPSGGQVVLIIPEEPVTLNLYLAMAAIVRQVADASSAGLTRVNASGNFMPVLAAELPTLENGGVSPDFLIVTWKLRPDLHWSDGQPITADDIKFTWEAVSNPESGAVAAAGFDLIESVEIANPQTAVIHYKAINQAYLNQFSNGVLPRHATGAPNNMLNWAWNRKPVGAGPFMVVAWNSGDSIIMERNPYYYLKGQPHLDRLIFKVVPDAGEQVAMMAQGEAQVHLWPRETKENYDAAVGEGAALQEIPSQWNMALRFNLSKPFDDDPGPQPPHPILGDLRVRQALAHAIDYDTLVNDINPGSAHSTTPFAYGWYRCDIARAYTYNVVKAQKLLDEAGWVMGDDGVRLAQDAQYAEDGTRLTLQMEGYTNFQPLVRLEEALVEMFKAVGVEVTIQNDDFSIIFGSYEEGSPRRLGNFDILAYDDSLSIEPHAAVQNLYHSKSYPSPENSTGGNYMRWVNARADAAIEAAGSTADIGARQKAYCELGNLIATDLPILNLLRYPEGYGAAKTLTGYQVNMWGSLTWDVQNWKLVR